MKICLVSHSFYPATFYGGPIFATWELAKRLSESGIEVFVSTTNANGKKRLFVEKDNYIKQQDNFFIKYYHEEIVNRFSVSYYLGIWKDIREVDLVYVQYLYHYTVLLAVLAAFIYKKKIIIAPRGAFSYFSLNNKFVFLKRLYLLFIGLFRKNIKWQASSYLEKKDILRFSSDIDVNIVNDGIEFNFFQDYKRINRVDLVEKFTGKKFQEVSYIFFSMGRLHSIKGFDIIIDAFKFLVQDFPAAKLLIAGSDDGIEHDLRRQIKELSLCDSVFLIGEVLDENKSTVLNNSDFFTLCSHFESFGIVIAEALSCGKPVIISNKTPWKDIEENYCGMFVNNDKNDFYLAFKNIIHKNYNEKNIKTYVKSRYDWEIILQDFIKFINN